jgi:hypothetical protein
MIIGMQSSGETFINPVSYAQMQKIMNMKHHYLDRNLYLIQKYFNKL